MSFALTADQVRAQSKTVTRRRGWTFAQVGDVVQPVVKAHGLKRGERVERLGPPIEITSVRREGLEAGMTWTECQLEGFPTLSPAAFVTMFVDHNGGPRHQVVTRIAFRYLE